MKKHMKLVILLTVMSLLGALAILPYQFAMSPDIFEQIKTESPIPVPIVLALGFLQNGVLFFALILAGVFLQEKTGLDVPLLKSLLNEKKLPKLSIKWIGLGVLVSFLGTIAVVLLDKFVFIPQITVPETATLKAEWWQGLLAMFYGGITEEVLLRLFLMTLLVWLLAKLFRKSVGNIPKSYYWIGAILAALIFGALHLPATAMIFGDLNTILVIRALLLNGILGVWFGYLYWKKGLEYAIISHMAADFFLHVIFANLI